MSNQTFFGSLQDFLGIKSEHQKSILQDRAEDVEYEEISSTHEDTSNNQLNRLLTEHSMTPYSIELSRRETLLKSYVQMERKIVALLQDFDLEIWRKHRGIDKCPYRWENVAHDNATEAFDEFLDSFYDALKKFEDSALQNISHLATFFGYDDEDFEQLRKEDREMERKCILKKAFEFDLKRLLYPTFDPNDDLPF